MQVLRIYDLNKPWNKKQIRIVRVATWTQEQIEREIRNWEEKGFSILK